VKTDDYGEKGQEAERRLAAKKKRRREK